MAEYRDSRISADQVPDAITCFARETGRDSRCLRQIEEWLGIPNQEQPVKDPGIQRSAGLASAALSASPGAFTVEVMDLVFIEAAARVPRIVL